MEQDERRNSSSCIKGFIHRVLISQRLPIYAAIVAIILTLPSLNTGLMGDDYHHKLLMQGSDSTAKLLNSPLDMFRFMDGDPERTKKIMDYGLFPWWTHEEVKATFWRPLASLTHWLDYKLWPDIVPVMHVQSILWFAALACVTTVLYRRLMGPVWVASLAAILYVVDDTHGLPVAFLANRSSLLATMFGVLVVIVHDRWRRDGWQRGAYIGPLLLAVSLLSKEAGIATCAYLFSYAVFMDEVGWQQKFKSLVPYLIVVVVWRVLWMALGYGVENTGFYVDPVSAPLTFVHAVISRASVLFLGQWAGLPSDIVWILAPGERVLLNRIGWIFLGLLAVIMLPLWRDRLARFWGLGMLLSVVPICAAMPSDRMLFFVGIGAMGLLAQFLNLTFGKNTQRPRCIVWRAPAVVLGFLFILIHLVIAPVVLPFRAAEPMMPKKYINYFVLTTPFDRSIESQDLIIVNPPVTLSMSFSMLEWESRGEPVPRHIRIFTSNLLQPVRIRRPDERTLVVRPEYGYYAWIGDQVFRGIENRMSVGQQVELTGVTIEITELTADGRPGEAAFEFSVPLEDASLYWLQWKDCAFVPFTPPPVGSEIELESMALQDIIKKML
jgi:hypothetical protein